MALVKANRTAFLAISALLAGCATVGPQRDATALSLTGEAAAKDELAAGAADAEPVIDFDGALLKAQTQRKMGDLAGAARTLSQMVLVAPDDPRVLGEYGKTLVGQGRSDDALAFIERAMELQSSDWTLYSAQGVAYDQKGDFRSAQAAYARALTLKPGDPSVMSNKALSHIQTGDLDEAERLLRAAAVAGGDYPRIASNLALVQSLKNSRNASHPAPIPEALAGRPAIVPAPATAAPAAVPAPAPAEPASVVNVPVESKPLKAAGAAEISASPPQPAAAASLRPASADPTIRMQRIPVDPLAGPVAPRKAAVSKKPTPKPDAVALRPSLNPSQQADAGR